MSDFVNTVDIIGDEALTNGIIQRNIVEIKDSYTQNIGESALYGLETLENAEFLTVKTIGKQAFRGCKGLKTLQLPNAQSLSENMCNMCESLTEVNAPIATTLVSWVFSGCIALEQVYFPNVSNVGARTFNGCNKLKTAIFDVVRSIQDYAFYGCTELITIIIRTETMATLNGTKVFNNTPISSGTGYIYVPAALVDSYKTAANWSTYANQIRAIEDYPEICDPYSWESVS